MVFLKQVGGSQQTATLHFQPVFAWLACNILACVFFLPCLAGQWDAYCSCWQEILATLSFSTPTTVKFETSSGWCTLYYFQSTISFFIGFSPSFFWIRMDFQPKWSYFLNCDTPWLLVYASLLNELSHLQPVFCGPQGLVLDTCTASLLSCPYHPPGPPHTFINFGPRPCKDINIVLFCKLYFPSILFTPITLTSSPQLCWCNFLSKFCNIVNNVHHKLLLHQTNIYYKLGAFLVKQEDLFF